MKTWAYIGTNEVKMNNMDLISSVVAVVGFLTNLTNVPINAGNPSNVAPGVEQVVTFNAADSIAYRKELQNTAAKHMKFFSPP